MAKKQTTKKTTAEPVMYYAMLAPELPITVIHRRSLLWHCRSGDRLPRYGSEAGY